MPKKVTTTTLRAYKQRDQRAVFVTAYDYPTATFAQRAGVDMILVGDSAAMTMMGLPNTLGVSMDEMIVFVKSVCRAAQHAFIIGDLPFLSYQPSDETAVLNAGRFIAAGCDAVKCEGGRRVVKRVRAMVDAGICVMGHLGLTPQNLAQLGGYRVQGKSFAAIERLTDDALALQEAGAFSILLEAMPSEAAAYVRDRLEIPVYGIGAGPFVDGQLVISHDILGNFVGDIAPRFVKQYAHRPFSGPRTLLPSRSCTALRPGVTARNYGEREWCWKAARCITSFVLESQLIHPCPLEDGGGTVKPRPIYRQEGSSVEVTPRRGVGLALGLGAIRYELCGPVDGPVVIVLGGISASSHITQNQLDQTAGWWETGVGPGRPIDTDRYCVVGIDYLTCWRATGNQSTPTRPVTTFDQAQAIEIVLDAIGVRTVRAIVGASYGGMIALAFAARTPERVERIVAISAAHQSDPMATAVRAIQRRIVRLSEDAGASYEGLALARALAMTTYRTRTEFSARFHNEPNLSEANVTFPAEEYVIARGENYAARTAPKDFCALTLSLDLHAVTPEAIRVPTTLIGVVEDQLVSIERVRQLHRRLGGPSRLIELNSLFGHDAFLKDTDRMAPFIAYGLEGTSLSIAARNEDRTLSHARAALGRYGDEANEQENPSTRLPEHA